MKTALKKTIVMIMIFSMMFVFIPVTGSLNAYADSSYTFGNDLYWGFNGNGILSITGTGSMQEETPWSEYKDEIVSVHIGDGVTDISSTAFKDCPNLTYVELGADVTSIGYEAFKNCPKLKEIWIPEGLRYINRETFYGCTSLTEVTLSGVDTLLGIEDRAFYNCSSLTSFEIPETVRSIGSYAFWGCSSLKEINIPEAVTSIGVQTFRGCNSLSKITVGAGNDMCYVKDGMLISMFNDGMGYPKEQVDFVVSGLSGELVIPESVSHIAYHAFENCADISKISIPAKVEDIYTYAFSGTDQIELIVDPANETYASYGGAIYDKDMTTLMYVAGGKDGKITVPEGVTAIADYACIRTGLSSITLPDSLTKIGQDAFQDCTKLTSITIPPNVTNESSDITLGFGAFSGCTSLTSITFTGERPPRFGRLVFERVTANAYFNHITDNTYWDDVKNNPQNYQFDGTINWIELKKTGWEQVGDNWYYYDKNGDMVKASSEDSTAIYFIDSHWAEFDYYGVWCGGQRFDGTKWITYGEEEPEEPAKEGWYKEDGYWYFYEKGVMVTSAWKKDSSGWCWLQEDGRMLTNGWAADNVGMCWIASNGYMPTTSQWVKYEGEWYHITKGYMDKSKWFKDSKGWCYVGADGVMVADGWAKDSKGLCWMDSTGHMLEKTQWVKYDGGWYYIEKGYMARNKWAKDSKGWCYLSDSGLMVTNDWVKDSKGYCWIGSAGYMVEKTQWLAVGDDWYYIQKGYRVQNKWMKDSHGWCWLGSDGKMLRNGWAKDTKGWCWIGSNGYMLEETRWIEDNGTEYYIVKGYMATGWQLIDGDYYFFDDSGIMQTDTWVGDYYVKSNGIMAKNEYTPDGIYVDNDGKNVVYWTPGGSVYHVSENCATLKNSETILHGSISESGKKDRCKVCGH